MINSSLGTSGVLGNLHKKIESWSNKLDSSKNTENEESTDAILEDFDFDKDNWKVVSVSKSKWQSSSGEWLESNRVNVIPNAYSSSFAKKDFDLLVKEVSSWKPSKSPISKRMSGDDSFVFCISDQQIGKRANNRGTKETVENVLLCTHKAINRLNNLKKEGHKIGTVAIVCPGDHVEGNVSQGGKLQSFYASDLGITEQIRVSRRLLMAQIKAFAEEVDHVTVIAVNGNHDEATRQVITDPVDGWNVEICSAVQDACKENKNLSHVSFRYPEKGNQTLTVNVLGTYIGVFHGHQSGRDVAKYLSNQSMAQTALGSADIWVSGHYHHFKAMDVGNRLWFQCPSIDQGSEWYRDSNGGVASPGVLTFLVGKDLNPRENISVISPSKIVK